MTEITDYTKVVVAEFLSAANAEWVGHRMRSLHEATTRTSRPDEQAEIWGMDDELFECVAHECACQVRLALAAEGKIEPEAEEVLGLALVEECDLVNRLTLSRIPRPPFERPSELQPTVREPMQLEDGEWSGWYRVGFIESELTLGGSLNDKIQSETFAVGAVNYIDGDEVGAKLPVRHGNSRDWLGTGDLQELPSGFLGPLVGIEHLNHWLLRTRILTPHPVLAEECGLRPAPRLSRLSLIDDAGHSAVVLRTWQLRPIDPYYIAGERSQIFGCDLLVRGDILDAIGLRASAPAREIVRTHVLEHKSVDERN